MSVGFDDYDDDYYSRRPSWREIDRRKDQSLHRRLKEKREKESAPKAIQQSEWLKEKYLKEVEKLFAGKKGQPGYEKALKKLQNAYGTPRFNKVARDFVKEYGLPEEWNLLLLFLEAKESQLVSEALEVLIKLYPERSPLEKQGFQAKVRTLSLVSDSEAIKQKAKKILEEISS